MPVTDSDRLRNIKKFDQLVAYLRDELDWPIETDNFDDLTFDYKPEELGIKPKWAAKIEVIKQLRPLVNDQPWGIFWIKFKPKRLPVVVLRRILGQLVTKKRASSNNPQQATWNLDDLMFISAIGEDDERQITFAHFANEPERSLPTLRILGWDGADTILKLDHLDRKLHQHLAWPDPGKEPDHRAWRERWSAAFKLRPKEVINTSKELSVRLAELARNIRQRCNAALALEIESGPLRKLMTAFRQALIHDLTEDDFADMYAQTIAYGLLSARVSRHVPGEDPALVPEDVSALVLPTNPFLKELMETFFQASGRERGKKTKRRTTPGLDFDELGINDVLDALKAANIDAVLRNFGDKNPQDDPVIHFYELFLKEYDAKKRMDRGVFYTPRPVVSFIVRSVDELLRKEFGLEDGLADTATWCQVAERLDDLLIPEGTSSDQAFVQILDPATGTGTFLVEVIGLIHKTMTGKWQAEGHGKKKIDQLWNDYVPKHLLPRLHGYELMMAPYAIAHMKIGLKLYETGYRFESDERARVYLTNALEPASSKQLALDFLPALAHEAHAVNDVKRHQRFTVVIGNPPYLGEAGAGGEWIAGLMRGRDISTDRKTASYFEVDGNPLNERNSKWINDDYVKFIRLSQWLLDTTGSGVHGYISNHGYLDNPTFRGVRWSLMSSFHTIHALDLHGNRKKREVSPDGGKDVNVFDIEQGVGIGLFIKNQSATHLVTDTAVQHADLWGERSAKYAWLINHALTTTQWEQVDAAEPFFLFVPFEQGEAGDYFKWPSLKDVMCVNGVGIVTARDHIVIDHEIEPIVERVKVFRDSKLSDKDTCKTLGIPLKKGWDYAKARRDLKLVSDVNHHLKEIYYRPFDTRHFFYHGSLVWRTVEQIMGHMLSGENLAIITTRQTRDEWGTIACRSMIAHKTCSAYDINSLFPLYLYPGIGKLSASMFNTWPGGKGGRRPNLDSGFVQVIEHETGLTFHSDGRGDLRDSFGPEDVLAYIYGIFYCPDYRRRFGPILKINFPRVPPPATTEQFCALVRLGSDLLALHFLESPRLEKLITSYTGQKSPEVGRVGWSDDTVWLDARKTNAPEGYRATQPGTIGFRGVPEAVWNFHIGGYQVCHKWLKDRKGRTLSKVEIAHYQKIVVALSETIRIMAEIDKVIEDHGGWPGAFRVEPAQDEVVQEELAMVAEPDQPYGD